MINRTILVGRLTKDPELRRTGNDIAVATFTLAVNRPFSNQQGDREADFINCVVWRRQAETVAQYVKKGSLVGVEGRINTRNYENEEGRTVYITEVVADSVQFLEPKGSSSSDNGYQESPSYNRPSNDRYENRNQSQKGSNNTSRKTEMPEIDIADDDLPF